ncbi:MAG: hypothetical protein NC182_04875 [Prevotella sp.]|nr:hypothetical protein [Staphylococcus sp.]MCM1350517.1 hypothetical protein [Prevotella sp.]
MKTLHYNGLDRNGRKQYLVINMTEQEAIEWLEFGIENNMILVDEGWSLQKKVQKILDVYYTEEYNQDRREFYHRNSSYDKIEDMQNEQILSPLDALIVEEENNIYDKEIETFLLTLTSKQRTRFEKYLRGAKIEEIAKEEGVHHSSISESIKQVQDKMNKKIKKF